MATRANTQPAYRCYLSDPEGRTIHPVGMLVLTLARHRIITITRFLNGQLPAKFRLAEPDVG